MRRNETSAPKKAWREGLKITRITPHWGFFLPCCFGWLPIAVFLCFCAQLRLNRVLAVRAHVALSAGVFVQRSFCLVQGERRGLNRGSLNAGVPVGCVLRKGECRGKWRTDGGRWCKRMLNDQLGAWPRFGKVVGTCASDETECGSNWSFLARNFLSSDVGLFLVSEEVAFDVTGCHARVLLWSVLV